MGEAQQAVGKILRHGYESSSPHDLLHVTNRSNLARELGHVEFAQWLLTVTGDIDRGDVVSSLAAKRTFIWPWLHHHAVTDPIPTPNVSEIREPQVWCAVRNRRSAGEPWELLGVFASRAPALAACTDVLDFVGPVPFGVALPLPPTPWPRAFYPYDCPQGEDDRLDEVAP